MSLNKGICKILVGCGAVLLLTTPVMADSAKMSGKMCSIFSNGTQLVTSGNDLFAGKGKGKGYGPGDGTGGGAPKDGSGYGPGDCTTGVFSFDPSLSLARGGAGNGGHGPGDGTGNGGTGPGDGTGNGPGTGTCTNA